MEYAVFQPNNDEFFKEAVATGQTQDFKTIAAKFVENYMAVRVGDRWHDLVYPLLNKAKGNEYELNIAVHKYYAFLETLPEYPKMLIQTKFGNVKQGDEFWGKMVLGGQPFDENGKVFQEVFEKEGIVFGYCRSERRFFLTTNSEFQVKYYSPQIFKSLWPVSEFKICGGKRKNKSGSPQPKKKRRRSIETPGRRSISV